MKNKVSIVIPTFNRVHFLDNCIDSCINQTQECEIIVCDHGSTDDTPLMVKKYGSRITYIRRELDSGVHFCWLDGILHASENLIHINFDDDWLEPTFIEKCARLFSDEVGCVLSDASIVYDGTDKKDSRIFNLSERTGIFSSKILKEINLESLTSPCAGIFRKEILLDNLFVGKVPFSSQSYHGVGPDLLFTLMSTISYEKFGFVAESLVNFRAHKHSITVDAANDKVKSEKIKNAYNQARNYFYMQSGINKMNPICAKLITKIIRYNA